MSAHIDTAARPIRLRFDPASFVVTVVLFVLLVLLATVGAHLGWVRSFLGDLLAVIWVYAGFKTFVAARPVWLAAAALAIGLLVEFGQYLAMAFQIHIPNRVVRVVFGSTPDWWDVFAYVLGFAAVLAIERGWPRWQRRKRLSPARAH